MKNTIAAIPDSRRQIIAWLVHLYTASGGVIGMFALFAAAKGDIREAYILICAAMLIDATDGLLARAVRVWEVLPDFSGSQVDNAVDNLTFIWFGIFVMWQAELLPHPAWTIIPVLAALYAYGQINMKTEDDFFLGFPSYWNVVALYMYWLQPAPIPAVLMVAIPGILTFIPTRYMYPSKNHQFSRSLWVLGLSWLGMILYLLSQENPPRSIIWISTFYPIYYTVLSFYMDFKLRYKDSTS